jgi:hypothetical protein
MIVRLVGLCVVQGVLVTALALQVFAAEEAAARTAGVTKLPVAFAPAAVRTVAAELPPVATDERSAPVPTAARSAVVARWRQDDPVGVLLMGSVRLRDGNAAEARLNFVQDKLRKGSSSQPDGSFALVGLQPGTWEVTVRGDNLVETKESITIGDDAVQQRDFVCDPSFPVKVRIVTADGKDATTALRTALPRFGDFSVAGQREPFPERFARTDYGRVFAGDAQWRPERNPSDGFAGTLYLTGLPAHVALLHRHLVLQQQHVPPGQQQVEFVVDIDSIAKLAAAATLRVVDEQGAPLPEAYVALHTSNIGGGGQPTDESGRITLEGLSPGLLQLEVQAKDRETVWRLVRVEPGQRVDLGEFRLGAALPLRGTVLDADGRPANGSLSWTELKWRTEPTAFRTNRSGRIDADGTFSLWGTGSGPIAVQVRAPDGRIAAGVFDNPTAEPVVLRLGPAAQCTVTRPSDPTRAFVVTVFDVRRQPVQAIELAPRVTKTTLSLPPGTYSFEVHDDDQRLVQSGSLTFGEAPCSLEIR